MKGPLDAEICVAKAVRRRGSRCAEDGQIGRIEIEFQVMREAVVDFEVCGVLADVGVLELEGVVLVEKLEVKFSSIGDAGVVGVEGQLSERRQSEAEETGKRQQSQTTWKVGHEMNIQNSVGRQNRQLSGQVDIEN